MGFPDAQAFKDEAGGLLHPLSYMLVKDEDLD